MSALSHPQPVGIHALPLGLTLVTDDAERVALLAGSAVEVDRPSGTAATATTAEPEPAADAAPVGDSGATVDAAVAAYNAFVLDPVGDPEQIRAALPASVAALVDVVCFTVGLADSPPALDPDAAPEVAAVVLATQASAALEGSGPAGDSTMDSAASAPDHAGANGSAKPSPAEGGATTAIGLLRRAADVARDASPVLAALLTANAATTAQDAGLPVDESALTAAAATLAGTDLHAPLAEIHLQLGQLAHERSVRSGAPLRDAMHHYYSALQLVTQDGEPELWARAQVALATAQLASPMTAAGDQLRVGIATQGLRAALRVLTREQHPAHWAGATLNLANALVYAPSMHQGDNLVEAVELYEQVLALRPVGSEPLGRARVLANQGNALAHLGIFEHARSNLVEARYLFESAGDDDAAAAVRGLLDEIVRTQSATRGHDGAQEAAAQARREEQMARMPVQAGPTTSGMGVMIGDVPPRPKVTVLPTRPTGSTAPEEQA